MSRPAPDADLSTKREVMASFFDRGLGARVAFLPDLASSGHEDEALTLCLLYIEGLGNSVYDDDTNSMRNFVRIIRDHGGADLFMLIHPGLLLRALPRDGRVAKATVTAVTPVLDARPTDFLDENELMDALAPAALSDEQAEWLRQELWRGTLAGIAYTYMRSPAVHYGLVSKPFFSTS